jgi:hypothetical protein
VRELQSGLWQGGWGPEVTSYASDDGEQLLLIDPLAPPRELAPTAPAESRVSVQIHPVPPWGLSCLRQRSASKAARMNRTNVLRNYN